MFWNTVVHICVFLIVRRVVQGGIEKAVKVLIPILFSALFVMVIYGFIAGDMKTAATFLLEQDFSKVNAGTVMAAIGKAFFVCDSWSDEYPIYGFTKTKNDH